jgi:hypothetical protein
MANFENKQDLKKNPKNKLLIQPRCPDLFLRAWKKDLAEEACLKDAVILNIHLT